MAAKLKKGDQVMVRSGRDKGRTGQIVQVLPKLGRAVVGGINIVKRHTKPSQASQGGIVDKELSLDLSNLSLIDPKDNKPTRVGFYISKDGKKVRIAKRSGQEV